MGCKMSHVSPKVAKKLVGTLLPMCYKNTAEAPVEIRWSNKGVHPIYFPNWQGEFLYLILKVQNVPT